MLFDQRTKSPEKQREKFMIDIAQKLDRVSRAQSRKIEMKKLRKFNRREFFERMMDSLSEFMVFGPLGDYHRLPPNQLNAAIYDLTQFTGDRAFCSKMLERKFQDLLTQLLLETRELQNKMILVLAFSNLTFWFDEYTPKFISSRVPDFLLAQVSLLQLTDLDSYIYLDRICTLFRNVVSSDYQNRFYTTLLQKQYFQTVVQKLIKIPERHHEYYSAEIQGITHSILRTFRSMISLRLQDDSILTFTIQILNCQSSVGDHFSIKDVCDLYSTIFNCIPRSIIESMINDGAIYERIHKTIEKARKQNRVQDALELFKFFKNYLKMELEEQNIAQCCFEYVSICVKETLPPVRTEAISIFAKLFPTFEELYSFQDVELVESIVEILKKTLEVGNPYLSEHTKLLEAISRPVRWKQLTKTLSTTGILEMAGNLFLKYHQLNSYTTLLLAWTINNFLLDGYTSKDMADLVKKLGLKSVMETLRGSNDAEIRNIGIELLSLCNN